MQVNTEMKHKAGKEPEGDRKKRKEVGKESPLASVHRAQVMKSLKVWKNYKKMNELFTSYLPSPDHCNHMNDVKIPVQRCSNDDDDCTKQLIP